MAGAALQEQLFARGDILGLGGTNRRESKGEGQQ
jgi:hypothetical protein